MLEPSIAPSSRKHGVSVEAIRHVFDNPAYTVPQPDGLTMLVGTDHAGNFLEIGIVDTDEGPLIVHAMPLRTKYQR